MNILHNYSALSLSLLIVIFSISWKIWRRLVKSSTKNPLILPPGPRGLPIVGFLPFLRADLHIQFAELAHKHGPFYKLWLGSKLCYVISSTSVIKEILRDHDMIFANRAASRVDLIGSYNASDVGFADYGTGWRMSRRIFSRDLMSNSTLDGTYDIRRDEVRREIRYVRSRIGIGAVNLCELSLRVNVNAVLRMTWGNTFGLVKRDENGIDEFLPLVAGFSDLMGKPNISDFFPILARFDFQGLERRMKNLMGVLDRVLEDLIDARLKIKGGDEDKADKNGRKDFVQVLIELMDKKDEKTTLDRIHTKAILIDVIVGGTQTSSSSIEWVMAELLNNPNELKKVQNELNQVVGQNNIVEESHIPKLNYLDAVIKETFRLHPIGPFLTPRTPSEPYAVGGYTIPKGCSIFLSLWSIHRDPLVWDNPLEFRPERFMGNIGQNLDLNGNNFNYIPFGSGRRICAGLPLANRMVKYVLASLLHSFDWKLPEGETYNMEDKFGSFLKKKDPLFAIPTPRLSDPNLYV